MTRFLLAILNLATYCIEEVEWIIVKPAYKNPKLQAQPDKFLSGNPQLDAVRGNEMKLLYFTYLTFVLSKNWFNKQIEPVGS